MTAPVHEQVFVDWVTVTHAEPEPLRSLLRGPVERLPNGIRHFVVAEQDGHGAIYASKGSEPRPYMLQMKGEALASWREDASDYALLRTLGEAEVNWTRLDLARDTSGPWTPYRLREFLKADRYVSTWREFLYQETEVRRALTVNCGSRSSRVFMRVYDKAAELAAKKKPCPHEQLSRWEFEFKGPDTNLVVEMILRSGEPVCEKTGAVISQLPAHHAWWLRKYLRLTEGPVDRQNHNQSRAVTDPEWEHFTHGGQDLILSPDLAGRSREQEARAIGRWARESLAPTLAFVRLLGGDQLLGALVAKGKNRLSAKHRMLLEEPKAALHGLTSGIVPERD